MGITQQGSRCKGELNAWDATQKPVGPRQNLSANERMQPHSFAAQRKWLSAFNTGARYFIIFA